MLPLFQRVTHICSLPILLLLLAGCGDTPTPTEAENTAEPPHSRVAANFGVPNASSLDNVFVEMAHEAPGFAGMYFDDGDLIVRTTGASSSEALLQTVQNADGGRLYRRPMGQGEGEPTIRLESAEWNFAQLFEWKQLVQQELWDKEMVQLDVSEVTNRVTVGVTTAGAKEEVAAMVQSSAIPSGAVEVQVVEPFRTTATLQDDLRPVRAGLQVSRSTKSICTLGFNVESEFEGGGFVMNSHCTDYWGNGGDNTYMYQATVSSSNFVGVEVADPDLYGPGGICPPSTYCRYSDAAFIGYLSSVNFSKGLIARTTGVDNGSITIGSTPNFLIGNAGGSSLMVGDTIYKIGRTSGWTSGVVTNTCQDTAQAGTNIYLLCQHLGSITNQAGDSGSPVFTWDGSGNYVDLHGITWGSDGTTTAFSQWLYIDLEINAEVGTLDVIY